MQRIGYWAIAGTALVGVSLVGCSARPAEHGLGETRDLVAARDAGAPASSHQTQSDANRAVQAMLAEHVR